MLIVTEIVGNGARELCRGENVRDLIAALEEVGVAECVARRDAAVCDLAAPMPPILSPTTLAFRRGAEDVLRADAASRATLPYGCPPRGPYAEIGPGGYPRLVPPQRDTGRGEGLYLMTPDEDE